jgi:hypothetical protein
MQKKINADGMIPVTVRLPVEDVEALNSNPLIGTRDESRKIIKFVDVVRRIIHEAVEKNS